MIPRCRAVTLAVWSAIGCAIPAPTALAERLYAVQSVIEERDGSDVRLRYHVNGAQYIDERVCTYDEGRGASTYYMANENFSVTGTANADGSVVEELDYSSTGDFVLGDPVVGSFYHDGNADLRLDLYDVGSFQRCFGETDGTCLSIHDFDAAGISDGDVDLDDFAGLLECFRGPMFTADYDCGRPGRRRSPPPSGTFTLHGRPMDVLSDGHTLLYVRARYYDPINGRWLQRDPSGYVDGSNLYESFRGNASRFRDPMGSATIDDPEEFIRTYLSDETALEYWILRAERNITLTVVYNPREPTRRPASHFEVVAGRVDYDRSTGRSYAVTHHPGGLKLGKDFISVGWEDAPEAVACRISQSIHAHWDALMGRPHVHGMTYEIIDLVLPLEEFEAVATYGQIGEYGLAAGYAGLGVAQTGAELYGAYWLAKGAHRVFVRCAARDVEEAFVTRVSGVGGKKGLVEYSRGPIAPGGDAASVAARRGKGPYGKVGGHHVHAKAGLKGHAAYDPDRGFSISQEYMASRGWKHEAMSAKQRQLFDELVASGRPNTLREHTRIAVESLRAGGATEAHARQIVAESLGNLRQQGVRTPSHIPWN